MLLYGASLIYGFAGSTAYADIATSLNDDVSVGLGWHGIFAFGAGIYFSCRFICGHLMFMKVRRHLSQLCLLLCQRSRL